MQKATLTATDGAKIASEIVRFAEESGVENNFLFTTTLERYRVQLKILTELEEAMKDDGVLVTKEYVKGRKNLYGNPAVTEYNKTSEAANRTASTLIKIIKSFSDDKADDGEDPLAKLINGGDSDE